MTNNGMPYLQIHMPRSRTWTSQFSEETTDTGGAVAKVAWQHASIVWNWEEVMASRRPGSSPSDSFGRLGVLSWRAVLACTEYTGTIKSNPTWHCTRSSMYQHCSLRLGSKEPKVYPEPAHPDLEESRKSMGSERLVVLSSMLCLLCSVSSAQGLSS